MQFSRVAVLSLFICYLPTAEDFTVALLALIEKSEMPELRDPANPLRPLCKPGWQAGDRKRAGDRM